MEKFKDSKFIFVVGIGGSDLASKAVWNAMTLHKPEIKKKVFFLESPDTREYKEMESFVKNQIAELEEIVLIAISKSGQTAETLEAFHKTYEILSKTPLKGHPLGQNFLRVPLREISERVLVISTPDSSLWKLAEQKGFEKIEWEGNIGGRFSAFTIAHTTVLSIAGLDAEEFKEGSHYAQASRDEQEKFARNIFDNYKNGFDILDFFIFNSELEDLGKWCRQLVAESLATITPTVSMGPVDLHSMLELYLGGPKNRFTVFIRSLKEIDDSINESAYEDVVRAYENAGLPFIKYEMEEINEKELGSFMAFMIAVIIKLAGLLGVDPYDQPAVENYKKSLHNS